MRKTGWRADVQVLCTRLFGMMVKAQTGADYWVLYTPLPPPYPGLPVAA